VFIVPVLRPPSVPVPCLWFLIFGRVPVFLPHTVQPCVCVVCNKCITKKKKKGLHVTRGWPTLNFEVHWEIYACAHEHVVCYLVSFIVTSPVLVSAC
jgi:hypothetical protein